MQALKTRPAARLFILAFIGLFLSSAQASVAEQMVLLEERTPSLSGRLSPAKSWPEGDVAVLLHGTLSHRDTEIIRSLETLLSEQGVSTLAINLSLGVADRRGPFACEGPHTHTEEDASDELRRWLDWLTAQGVENPSLIGHSRGANQIARYVYENADPRVARMILIAPPQWSEESSAVAYAARHGQALAPLLAEAEQQITDGKGSAMLPDPVGLLYCENTRVSAESFASYYRADPLRDTPTLLARQQTPTLIIAGSADEIASGLPAAMAERAPAVEVVEIEGADHFFRDLYADELVEYAIDFIDQSE
jgi:pimeloyl-ACP methyl ester carboxylesterase